MTVLTGYSYSPVTHFNSSNESLGSMKNIFVVSILALPIIEP